MASENVLNSDYSNQILSAFSAAAISDSYAN
jgi:hypothetical protein